MKMGITTLKTSTKPYEISWHITQRVPQNMLTALLWPVIVYHQLPVIHATCSPILFGVPDSKVHGANMGPMNFAIWGASLAPNIRRKGVQVAVNLWLKSVAT